MATVARSKEVVVIAPDLRAMVAFLLPPVHNESLLGILAPYSNVTLSEDEWDEARERAWSEATENEDAPRR